MKKSRRIGFVVAAVLTWPVVVAVQSGRGGSGTTSVQWATVGGMSGNTRYSTLTRITAENVATLGAAWKSERFAAPASSRAMPVVVDGVIYVTAPPAVYAIDAKSGATRWRYQAVAGERGGRGQGAAAPGVGAPAREGVAVAEGLVFVGTSTANAMALDQKTGAIVWTKYLGDNPRDKGQVISGTPVYAAGLVSYGLSADNGWRGQVVALEAKTGKEVWRFFAIPGVGQKGHETWPANSNSWKRGGAAVWLAGTVDPDLNTVYYVTGNGVPQLGGEGRAGDNLYLCSVVALDVRTGALKWHYQVLRHDVWEADIAISPVLYDAEIEGRPRKGIAAMRADGFLFLLDRETGKPFGKVEDRPVPQDAHQKTAATQPFPVGADRVLDDCEAWRTKAIPKGFEVGCFFTPPAVAKPNILAPSYGMRVAPMAYSPRTRYFYVTGAAALSWLRRAEDPYFFSNFNRVPGLSELSYGVLAAIDSRTNKIVWKKTYKTGRPSGATVTATDLMFQSSDRMLEAIDAKSGNALWTFQTGAAGGPAVTYDLDGDQYVAVVSGAVVWGFKIGGTVAPAPAGSGRSEPELFTGTITDTSQIETASLQRDRGFTGTRFFTDVDAFEPYRARVKVHTPVTWRNNSALVHTIVALDGSWTTGPLENAEVGAKTFDTPGTYTYICKEHPWAYGQVIVVE